MSTRFTLLVALLLTLSACSTDESDPVGPQTVDEISYEAVTELIRLHVNEEYGGILKLHKLFHEQVYGDKLPCDSTLLVTWKEEVTGMYSMSGPVEITTDCRTFSTRYNDRIYRSSYQDKVYTANGPTLSIEGVARDHHTIGGNTADERYTFSHSGRRYFDIVEGMDQALNPEGSAIISFPLCKYDAELVEILDITVPIFGIVVELHNKSTDRRESRTFKGELKKADNSWTAVFEEGPSIPL